jgi:hypothetical protein
MFNNININNMKKIIKNFYEIRVDLKSRQRLRDTEELTYFLSESAVVDFMNFFFVEISGSSLKILVYTGHEELSYYNMYYLEILKAKSYSARDVTSEIFRGSYSESFFWDVIENIKPQFFDKMRIDFLDNILEEKTNIDFVNEKIKKRGYKSLLPSELKIYRDNKKYLSN